MRNFVVNLELTFMAETDAKNLFETAGALLHGIDAERETALIKQLQQQVVQSTKEMQCIVDDGLQKRANIEKVITEAKNAYDSLKQREIEVTTLVSHLHQQTSSLFDRIESDRQAIVIKIDQAQTIISKSLADLHELDEAIRQAKQRIEACQFIRDMASVNKALLTSGKAVLSDKDDLGNWKVSQTWQK